MKIDELFEAAPTRRKVVRKGKVQIRKKCGPGFKLKGNRCVRQKASERIKRSKGARRGAKKSRSARRRSQKRSIRLRQRRGL